MVGRSRLQKQIICRNDKLDGWVCPKMIKIRYSVIVSIKHVLWDRNNRSSIKKIAVSHVHQHRKRKKVLPLQFKCFVIFKATKSLILMQLIIKTHLAPRQQTVMSECLKPDRIICTWASLSSLLSPCCYKPVLSWNGCNVHIFAFYLKEFAVQSGQAQQAELSQPMNCSLLSPGSGASNAVSGPAGHNECLQLARDWYML